MLQSSITPGSQVRAVLFDAYGTLFDVYSIAEVAEAYFPGHGQSLAALWRDKQIDYTRLCSMADRWRPFRDLTRSGLRYAAARLGLPMQASDEAALMDAYRALRPHADVLPVLHALRERGVRAGILSNADTGMLTDAVEQTGLSDLVSPLISVEATRRFKTDPACYALGPQTLGLPPAQILFVSSNGWDAIGATWAGYTTLWVNRTGLPLESLDTEPTRTARSLDAALQFFD